MFVQEERSIKVSQTKEKCVHSRRRKTYGAFEIIGGEEALFFPPQGFETPGYFQLWFLARVT